MWSYSTGMFMAQWGLFILLGIYLLQPLFDTEEWFGMMLPVGFMGGFGTAAAVGQSLEGAGAEGAASLGFASATVGQFVAIIGGVILANWGIRTGRASQLGKDLPEDMRSGYIENEAERPSIGKATTNPSAIEPLALHGGLIIFTVLIAHLINQLITSIWPAVSIPLFAMSFVVGLLGRFGLRLVKRPNYVDKGTVSSISGAATDYLVAFGIASIVPAAIADQWVALVVLLVAGTIFCLIYMFVLCPIFFGEQWFERAVFVWGWSTGAVATGIAVLKIADPKLESGTLNDYGVAYVGFAPFEIAMTILAPIAVTAGLTAGFGWVSLLVAIVIVGMAFWLKWLPGRKGANEGASASS